MSTSLYKVKVTQKTSPQEIELDIQSIYGDCLDVEKKHGFVFMCLFDGPSKDNSLQTEFDIGSLVNADWIKEHAKGVIEGVELVETIFKAPKSAANNPEHAYFQDPSKWVRWRLNVTVTHEEWIKHLKEGDQWDTIAYEPLWKGRYLKCKPLLPTIQGAINDKVEQIDYTKGFYPLLPCFVRGLQEDNSGVDKNQVILYPIYTQTSYIPVNTIKKEEGITPEKIQAWIGRAVVYQYSNGSTEIGILNYNTKKEFFFKATMSGTRGIGEVEELNWIGLATINPKKRKHVEELSPYDEMIDVSPVISKIKVEQNRAYFTITHFSKKRITPIKLSSAGALEYLESPFSSSTKLVDILEKIAVDKNEYKDYGSFISMNKPAIYTIAGNAIIKNIQIGETTAGTYLDENETFDFQKSFAILSEHQLPTTELMIEVTDEAWVEHLKIPLKTYVSFYSNDLETEVWQGEVPTKDDL